MRDAARTLRTTVRSLARQPGLTLAVIVTLALGIGAATALFAYLAAILWPGLDAPDAGRAVWLSIGSRRSRSSRSPTRTSSISSSGRGRCAT